MKECWKLLTFRFVVVRRIFVHTATGRLQAAPPDCGNGVASDQHPAILNESFPALIVKIVKKLTERYRRWLLYRQKKCLCESRRQQGRSKRKEHRQIVDAWFGSHHEKLLVREGAVSPPRVLCFDHNRDQTLLFLESLRHSLSRSYSVLQQRDVHNRPENFWVNPGRHASSLRWIRRYHDYSKIETISTAAALVLAAEYDRFRRLCGSVPPTINLHDWHPELFRKLYEVGFFEIVGLAEDVAERYSTDGDVRIMRILSGTDAEQNAEAAQCILQLAGFIEEQEPIAPHVRLALNS